MLKVSIVIPTIPGRTELLGNLLKSIPKEYAQNIIIMPQNEMLLAEKRNKGASEAMGDYIIFVDDDNTFCEESIDIALANIDDSIGVMGFVACYDDKPFVIADGGSNRGYWTGLMRGINTNKAIWSVSKYIYEVDEVANCFMIKRSLFEKLGGFDEANFPIDLDEADLCKRAKDNGYRVVMSTGSVVHHKSQTYSRIPDFRRPLNAYYMARNKVLFERKHVHPYQFFLYALFFLPPTWLGYMLCLLLRRKPKMCYHFTKGMLDGLSGRIKNKYKFNS